MRLHRLSHLAIHACCYLDQNEAVTNKIRASSSNEMHIVYESFMSFVNILSIFSQKKDFSVRRLCVIDTCTDSTKVKLFFGSAELDRRNKSRFHGYPLLFATNRSLSHVHNWCAYTRTRSLADPDEGFGDGCGRCGRILSDIESVRVDHERRRCAPQHPSSGPNNSAQRSRNEDPLGNPRRSRTHRPVYEGSSLPFAFFSPLLFCLNIVTRNGIDEVTAAAAIENMLHYPRPRSCVYNGKELH